MDHPLLRKAIALGLVSQERVDEAADKLRLSEEPSERRLATPYACVTSAHLHEVLRRSFDESPASTLLLNAEATTVESNRVALADGRVLEGSVVVQAFFDCLLGRTNGLLNLRDKNFLRDSGNHL